MSPSKDDMHASSMEKGDMLRDSITSGALDDLFLGGAGVAGGSGGVPALSGLNGKLMGGGVGANPLAAIFAASNAGGMPSPTGIQQVYKYQVE